MESVWIFKEADRQTDRQTDKQTDKAIYIVDKDVTNIGGEMGECGVCLRLESSWLTKNG